MGTITLSIDDETERNFRKLAKKVIGEKKGHLGEAATDACKLWIHEKTQDVMARDALELIHKKYDLGERLYNSRTDLYEE